MTFMQNLSANPSGSSGIYGMPSSSGGVGTGDVLDLLNHVKDREFMDFKNKANFMADLSNKQDRMKAVFDPNKINGGGLQQPQQMNTVLGQDPNQMTGYEKGKLALEKEGQGLERQKIGQAGRLGQEALDIKGKQEELNRTKSEQIHEQKQKDLERKIEDSNNRLGLAYEQLNSKNTNAESALAAHKEMAAAMEERHKLELASKDAQYEQSNEIHRQAIAALEARVKQAEKSTTTTEVNPEGTRRTVTTQRGNANEPVKNPDGTYQVIGKDGQKYNIPANKLDDWNANHKPDSDQEE